MQLLCMQYHTKTRLKENSVLDSQGPKIQKDESPTCVVIIINLLGVYSYRTFHLVPVLLVDRLILICTSFSTKVFPLLLLFHYLPFTSCLAPGPIGCFQYKSLALFLGLFTSSWTFLRHKSKFHTRGKEKRILCFDLKLLCTCPAKG